MDETDHIEVEANGTLLVPPWNKNSVKKVTHHLTDVFEPGRRKLTHIRRYENRPLCESYINDALCPVHRVLYRVWGF